jgi:hypothetical protein
MSLDLLKKEILDHLLSLRLILAFVLIIILLVASSVLFVAEYKTQVSDFNAQVNDNLTFLSKNLTQGIFQAFSFTRQNIYRRPNPLGFLADRIMPCAGTRCWVTSKPWIGRSLSVWS